jgi:hypothetical protein
VGESFRAAVSHQMSRHSSRPAFAKRRTFTNRLTNSCYAARHGNTLCKFAVAYFTMTSHCATATCNAFTAAARTWLGDYISAGTALVCQGIFTFEQSFICARACASY